jgi:CHAD domain-containing protein
MKKELEIQGMTADTPFGDAASAIILDRLENMIAHEQGVRLGEDIEALHDMRVYSRRLREALRIFKPCFPKKRHKDIYGRVRDVTAALGDVRNLDVFIEYFRKFKDSGDLDPACAEAADALTAWAAKQREGLREKMIAFLDHADLAELADDLRDLADAPKDEDARDLLVRLAASGVPVAHTGAVPDPDSAGLSVVKHGQDGFAEAAARELMARGCIRPRDYKEFRDVARKMDAPAAPLPLLIADPVAEHARRIIPERFEAMAALWREAMPRREDPDIAGLHALRISFKKLRYAFEILYLAFDEEKRNAVYARMKEYQDILGDLHDADVFFDLGYGKLKNSVKKDRPDSALGFALLAHRLRQRREELVAAFYALSDEYPLEALQRDLWDAFHAGYAPPPPEPQAREQASEKGEDED